MSAGCKICDDLAFRAAVDEELSRGNSFSYIARVMTARGFSVTPPTVANHKRHQSDYIAPAAAGAAPPGITKRDIATILRDRMAGIVETMDDADLIDKDNQPFIGNAIKTQAVIDKREVVRKGNTTFVLQLAGALAERLALPEPVTIEGEAFEVD
jgi:hypothetical protein